MKAFTKFALGVTAAIVFGLSQAHAVIYFSDTFSYADGPISNVSAGVWSGFSGASTVNVSNGTVIVSQALTQDVAAQLGSVHSNDIIFAKYEFMFDLLPGPTNTGTSYFSMFKDSGTSLFLGRTMGAVVPAESPNYRLGATAAASSTPNALFPTALTTGVWYTAVLKVDQTAIAAPVVTLWVNPTLESDPSASHTSTLPNLAISTFAFRQATLEGRVNIDNLVIGDSFSAVVPEPSTVLMVGLGLVGLVALRRRRS